MSAGGSMAADIGWFIFFCLDPCGFCDSQIFLVAKKKIETWWNRYNRILIKSWAVWSWFGSKISKFKGFNRAIPCWNVHFGITWSLNYSKPIVYEINPFLSMLNHVKSPFSLFCKFTRSPPPQHATAEAGCRRMIGWPGKMGWFRLRTAVNVSFVNVIFVVFECVWSGIGFAHVYVCLQFGTKLICFHILIHLIHLMTNTSKYTPSMSLSYFVMVCPKRAPKQKEHSGWWETKQIRLT